MAARARREGLRQPGHAARAGLQRRPHAGLPYELDELDEIMHRHGSRTAARGPAWRQVDIVVDSLLAVAFTAGSVRLREHFDRGARRKLAQGRHPLAFEQVTTIAAHATHPHAVEALACSGHPAIVIAATGMCSGSCIVNQLKAMLGNTRHDLLFFSCQAAGAPGRDIQTH